MWSLSTFFRIYRHLPGPLGKRTINGTTLLKSLNYQIHSGFNSVNILKCQRSLSTTGVLFRCSSTSADSSRASNNNSPSHTSKSNTQPDANGDAFDQNKWRIVYRFPHITTLRLLCKMKIYQTAATIGIVPIVLAMAGLEKLTMFEANFALTSCLVASGMLLVIGSNTEKVIGIIYENENRSQVRLAHLTFWGHRKDVLYNTADIAHFSDVGEKMDEMYLRVVRHSKPDDCLYLFVKYGGILDQEAFERIFGFSQKAPVFKVTK